MRSFLFLALAFAVLSSPLGPASEAQAAPERTGFVGFTTTGWTGGSGILIYNIACNNDFPGSRMCDAEEVAKTVNTPNPIDYAFGTVGWVRPSLADANNVLTTSDEDCDDWTSTSGNGLGLFVEIYGIMKPVPCNASRPVACCIPERTK